MIYQLPNGKCIEMSIEQYLRMSDEDLKNLVAYNLGEEFNDPFMHSVLRHGPARDDFQEDLDDDFSEEDVEDLLDVAPEDKLLDDDYIDYDNLEQ
jgi:hypothetical protein